MTSGEDVLEAMLVACTGVLQGITTDGVQPAFAVVLWPPGRPDSAIMSAASPEGQSMTVEEIARAIHRATFNTTKAGTPVVGRDRGKRMQ